MNIRLKGTKIALTSKIKDYVQSKMDMLDKYLGDIKVANCDVEIGKVRDGQNSGEIYKAEVNLAVPGELLRVEKTEKDLFKAIDKIKDHLARSIKNYKEKKRDIKRKGKAK